MAQEVSSQADKRSDGNFHEAGLVSQQAASDKLTCSKNETPWTFDNNRYGGDIESEAASRSCATYESMPTRASSKVVCAAICILRSLAIFAASQSRADPTTYGCVQ